MRGLFKRGGHGTPPPPPPRKPSKYKNKASSNDDDQDGLPDWFDENDGAPPVPPRWSRGESVPRTRSMIRQSFGKSSTRREPLFASSSNSGYNDADDEEKSDMPGYSWESSGAGMSSYGSSAPAAPTTSGGGGGGGYSWESSTPASTGAKRSPPPRTGGGGGGGYSWETSNDDDYEPVAVSNGGNGGGYSWDQPSGRMDGGTVKGAAPSQPSSAPAAWMLPRRSVKRDSKRVNASPYTKPSPSARSYEGSVGSASGSNDWHNNGKGWRQGGKPNGDASWMRSGADDEDQEPAPAASYEGYSWSNPGTGNSTGGGGYSWENDGRAAESPSYNGGGSGGAGGYSWEQPSSPAGDRSSSRSGGFVKRLSSRLSGRFSTSRGASDSGGPEMVSYKEGSGCYLIFETNNNGVLYAQWSEDGSAPANAWAFFRPQKKVPGYKYKQKNGRVDIIKVGGDKKKVLEGVSQFIKEAVSWRATLVPLDHNEVRFDSYVLTYELDVRKLNRDQAYETARLEAVAVVPRASFAFEGIEKTSRGHFLSTGNKYGVTTSL